MKKEGGERMVVCKVFIERESKGCEEESVAVYREEKGREMERGRTFKTMF